MSITEPSAESKAGNRLLRPVAGFLVLQLLIIFLLAVLVFRNPANRPEAWDYKVEQISDQSLEDRLNILGKQGWELVSLRHEEGYEAVLKRPQK